jgi:hypothetical protein
VYVGRYRRYRFVFKHVTSGSPGKKITSVMKKRDADDFCEGNIRQLIYRKLERQNSCYSIRNVSRKRSLF